jgi:4-diphosphocytidyl-2C-methyl-D-erythritol kinase
MMLRKRIPVDAGLGGGSSDAAATLRGLNDLWRLNWATERLAELGADVGSDVPFFFYGPTALVSGRGEVVERVSPLARVHVVLLRPATGVSTGRVFAEFSAARYSDGTPTTRLLEVIARGAVPDSWPLSNGLQAMVTELYPEVASALQSMHACGAAQAIMTGSGSTVYSPFARLDDARRVHDCLRAAGHFSILTKTA